ncbi:hypothetical protein PCANC_05068 [Puccinia coronata f. sp. avenae]|uniref:Uncharacterized protein n=1 Tax=Puccinia coronata f. sp. avenae TaxID=200324 RepID=A0A2N5T737_9BASI|nr:hypothetical protein PCANC_05068 [Puccinia coronata f. sp. avenae]
MAASQLKTTRKNHHSKLLCQNIAALKTAHRPVEQLTGSSDLNVYIHPSNDNCFVALNMDCIALWACTMIENPEVMVETPPVSRSFPVVTKAKYYMCLHYQKREFLFFAKCEHKQQLSGLHHEYAQTKSCSNVVFHQPNNPMMAGGCTGHPNPLTWLAPWAYGHHPMMYPGPHQPAYQNENTAPAFVTPPTRVPVAFATPAAPAPAAATVPNSSPVPYNMALDLNNYLKFVDVKPTKQLSAVIHNFGITCYTGFALVKAEELKKAGIKLVLERLLVSRVKEYKQHLKGSYQGRFHGTC